jgi:hypothetical protein
MSDGRLQLPSRRRRRDLRRRERLGEWAAALVLLLNIVFWCLWPRGAYRPVTPPLLPEAGAAYVQVVVAESPLAMRADRLTQRAGDGLRLEAALPLALDPPPPPILSPPPRREAAAATSPPLPAIPLPSLPAPSPLVAGPPPPSLPLAPAPPRPALRLSPGLRRAGFRFEPPAGVVTGAVPGRARFRIVLDTEGRAAHVLAEEIVADAATARALAAALRRGTGGTNAVGSIEIEW